MAPPIKPEQFDYLAAVDAADNSGFNWQGLFQAVSEPGFKELSPEQQRHIGLLLQVKIAKEQGVRADPFATTGELGGLRQVVEGYKGTVLTALTAANPVLGRQSFGGLMDLRRQAEADYAAQGLTVEQAQERASQDMWRGVRATAQQFAHYVTGGLVDAPEESKDPFVQELMESRIRPMTGLGAIGTQLVTGTYALGMISKIPLVSSRVANLSAVTRGMIKGGILDFGINAAWPEGLPREERFGVSDDIARLLAPESVEADPTSLMGRLITGVGGAIEGAFLGGALYAIGYGIKLADAKYGLTLTKSQVERMRRSLELAGVDVSGMSRSDLWLTYRQRMKDHVQGIDEAVFNGQRLSAEQWIAQAFIADPNVTELTPVEGRLLWGIFSTNRGGVSILRNVDDPTAALDKLKKVGINVEAHVIPRGNPGAGGVSATNAPSGPTTPTPKLSKAEQRARRLVGDEEFNNRVRLSLSGIEGPLTADKLNAHIESVAQQVLKDRPGARVAKATARAREAERRLADAERRATTDELTGLQNANGWKAAETRINTDPNLEVIALDVQNFKAMNDLVSHAAGDELLRRIAQSLLNSVKKVKGGVQVFRKGGDEFVIVVPKGRGQSVLEQVLKDFGVEDVQGIKIKLRGGVGGTFDEADAAEKLARQQQTDPAFRPLQTGEQPQADVPPPKETPKTKPRRPRTKKTVDTLLVELEDVNRRINQLIERKGRLRLLTEEQLEDRLTKLYAQRDKLQARIKKLGGEGGQAGDAGTGATRPKGTPPQAGPAGEPLSGGPVQDEIARRSEELTPPPGGYNPALGRLQDELDETLAGIRESGQQLRAAIKVVERYFPHLTERQVEALADGLLKGEDWAHNTASRMLRPNADVQGGWQKGVREREAEGRPPVSGLEGDEIPQSRQEGLESLADMEDHWSKLSPQQRMDLFGADPTAARIDNFKQLPLEERLRYGRQYRRGQLNRELAAEDLLARAKRPLDDPTNPVGNASKERPPLSQRLPVTPRIRERIAAIWNNMDAKERFTKFDTVSDGSFDKLPPSIQDIIIQRFIEELSPKFAKTLEELAAMEEYIIQAFRQGTLEREPFAVLIRDISIRRRELRGS